MKIEDITPEILKDKKTVPNSDLYHLRVRCIQVFTKHFEKSNRQAVGDLKRTVLLAKYKMIIHELRDRGLRYSRVTELDRVLMKRALQGVDVSNINTVILEKNYISIGGHFLRAPKSSEKVDVFINDIEENLCEDTEGEIIELIKRETGKEPNIVFTPGGPKSRHIPVFDLVLQSRTETIKEPGIRKRKTTIQKPEETETQIRIPVGPGCQITATITIDAERGIQALYCGKEKTIQTYLFDKDKWTMAEAKAWIKEHKNKFGKNWVDVEKSTNHHECINRDWHDFRDGTWVTLERVSRGKRYKIRMAQLKEKKGPLTEHSYLYPVEIWSVAEARGHCKAKQEGDAESKVEEGHKFKPAKEGDNIEKSGNFVEKTKNQHECRHREPGEFQEGKYAVTERQSDGKRYQIVMGRLKGKDTMTEQAYRYYKDEWTEAAARAHCKKHDGKTFTPAEPGPVEKAVFKIVKIDKKKQIVGGIVYAPGEEDSQGDYTDAGEIQKAMYKFMEGYAHNTARIKVMHKGRSYDFPILEVFQPEEDTKKGGQMVKAGAWWVMIKVKNKPIWDKIESGELTGFSMGGQAQT